MSNIKAILKAIQHHGNMVFSEKAATWFPVYAVADYADKVICISDAVPIGSLFCVKLKKMDPESIPTITGEPYNDQKLLVDEKGGVLNAVDHYNTTKPVGLPFIINFHLVDRSEELMTATIGKKRNANNDKLAMLKILADLPAGAFSGFKIGNILMVHKITSNDFVEGGIPYERREMTKEELAGDFTSDIHPLHAWRAEVDTTGKRTGKMIRVKAGEIFSIPGYQQ